MKPWPQTSNSLTEVAAFVEVMHASYFPLVARSAFCCMRILNFLDAYRGGEYIRLTKEPVVCLEYCF
jgi:hypothetical protein